jgi:hypothetical protein
MNGDRSGVINAPYRVVAGAHDHALYTLPLRDYRGVTATAAVNPLNALQADVRTRRLMTVACNVGCLASSFRTDLARLVRNSQR